MIEITDKREREEALDTTASFVVQAPAGSGKTELLMQRYLALLSLVEKPEEILALTFTKKAAGEMQSRILEAMLKVKSGYQAKEPHEAVTLTLAKNALKRDSEMGWGLIENPGRLKVQTIDSLCASLVRQMPVLSGMGKQPSISEDPEELYSEAARRTIELVEEDSRDGLSVRKALRHLDNSIKALTDRLVIMLGKRDQWIRHIKRGMGEEDARAFLEGSIKRLVSDELKKIRCSFSETITPQILSLGRYAAANLIAEGVESPITSLDGIDELPSAQAESLHQWRGIAELFLTKENEWRKRVDKNSGFPDRSRKNEFLELIGTLDNIGLLEPIANTRSLPFPAFDEEEWEILDALLHLLPIAEKRLNEIFAEEGEADFQAVSMAALVALGGEDDPTDLMLSLDLKIKHILVDEYQDTSRTQLALLKALTRGWSEGEGRTLFVVGDPMQSIYLFREAEVGLFLEAKETGINGIKLKPLQLKSNFRSQKNIVDWVNGAFTGAFPMNEDVFTGSVSYASSDAVKGKAEGAGVDITLFDGRDDKTEADNIVSAIKKIDKEESIAILCRSRRHLDDIVETLKREGLKFSAREFDPLMERTVIKDLFALLRALLHPYDRVAWLAALRAPWCGIKLDDLHRLCLGDKASPVWKLLKDENRIHSLSEEGRARVSVFIEKFDTALSLKGRIPPRELLEGLWISLGGPACVPDAAGMEDAEAFLDLVSSVSRGGEIDFVKSIEARMDKLFASHGNTETNLTLMTIHKAKGLEFDHVFLPGLGRKPKPEEKKLLLWLERGDDLLLAPVEKKTGESKDPIYEFLRNIVKEKLELEETRLFYVAVTRAKKALYLSGHLDASEGMKAEKRSFLSKILPALREDMVIPAAEKEEDAARGPHKIKRLPISWKAPAPMGSAINVKEAREASIGKEPEFYWAGEAVRHLGTVVHKYLCRIARDGAEKWSAGKVDSEKDRMRVLLMELGLNKETAAKEAARGVKIISDALNDKRGRWIFDAREGASVELPVTAVIKGEIVHAVIDRTFVDKGVRWIIDYKTGTHEGGGLSDFLASERERYRPQLEKYAEVLKAGGETREIKMGLYYPALGEWVEV